VRSTEKPKQELTDSQRKARKLRARLFWAIKTGIEYHNDERYLRLLTVTSSNESPQDIRKSFRKLLFLLRANKSNKAKKIEFVAVETFEGNGVIHALCIGDFIKRDDIIEKWKLIHKAWSVDIRAVDLQDSVKFQKYVYGQYILGQSAVKGVFWSKKWMWRGALVDWSYYKHELRGEDKRVLYAAWSAHMEYVRRHRDDAQEALLSQFPLLEYESEQPWIAKYHFDKGNYIH
jgi:hypothetical protein